MIIYFYTLYLQVSVIGCNICLLEITLGEKRMPLTTFDVETMTTSIDYTKLGDTKQVYFLTKQFEVKTSNGWSNNINRVLHDTLVNPRFDDMNLNIVIWFSSDDILKALDTIEEDYADCFTDEINIMKDMVNEYYDSEWIVEYGF